MKHNLVSKMAKKLKCFSIIFSFFLFINKIEANYNIEKVNINDLKYINVTEHLGNMNITQRLDDTKRLIEEKCKKVSGDENAYDRVEEGGTKLYECITNLVNVTQIEKEIEEARPNGRLDEVFNKYCKKRPEALDCFQNFETTLTPCMDDEEISHYETLMRIFKSILNFVCYKGGDQIALFIAEKGPECLAASKKEIGECLNKTFGDYMPKEGFESMESLPKFIIGPKQCNDILSFEKCTVKALEKCEDITPANIIESMFKFIKNETVCATPKSSAMLGNHADKTILTSLLMLFMIFCNYLLA